MIGLIIGVLVTVFFRWPVAVFMAGLATWQAKDLWEQYAVVSQLHGDPLGRFVASLLGAAALGGWLAIPLVVAWRRRRS